MEPKHRFALAGLLVVLLGGAIAGARHAASNTTDHPIVITTAAGAATTPAVAPTPTAPSAPTDATAPSPKPAPPAAPPAALPAVDTSAIVVHVAGAVKKPNVYKFHAGARVYNAIDAAGGAKDTAALDAINLAEKLTDGEKIYVPTRAEAKDMPPAASTGPVDGTGAAKATPSSHGSSARGENASRGSASSDKLTDPKQGVVYLHSATLAQLERLPGVGPAIAQRILDYRHQVGGFKAIDDLQNVSGIGEKKFAKMKPFVRL